MTTATKDKYGWAVIIDGFRSAMPDEKTARLTSSAPDMLDALKKIIEWQEKHDGVDFETAFLAVEKIAQDAIAKVE